MEISIRSLQKGKGLRMLEKTNVKMKIGISSFVPLKIHYAEAIT